ncbi:aminotransferase class V-fold PLP-dependent enzyme [Hydrogenophaga sp.]|uniref:aminotransferase class V-fold PLP-dependent enzyme n=1 Tax=Hydrogenophaga sp. TaxID=1904254 RepID=UPI00271FB985|nr:aminotransferase class V-fold PLP-dependent enzyme [Hydrogenophaga sp.]MDO9435701.1 aminotransferase class V-fold PLP-dependent enzyme [Hydrogenophaga sp.]
MHTEPFTDPPPAHCGDFFPLLRDHVYLDTGSAGIALPTHPAAAARFYEDKAAGYLGRERWQARAASVRARLAAWLGVEAREVEFFSGTTDALNIVGHSLSWQSGDEIVVASDEFPSVRLAWSAAEREGATVRLIDIANESEREDALIAALSPRTRVLVVAHVHSMTGTRLDLDRLGRACRENGCLFVVDGIHALGATPVHLEQVDVYMAGVFKWLLAGFGLAVCVVRDRARERMRPAFRGYLNQPPENGLQFAHCNYPGVYALEASLDFLGDTIGWDVVHGRTAQLVQWLADDLAGTGIELASPPGARAGIASFRVPDPEKTRLWLVEQGVHVAARGPYLRASPFVYNARSDVARLAALVGEFLEQHK